MWCVYSVRWSGGGGNNSAAVPLCSPPLHLVRLSSAFPMSSFFSHLELAVTVVLYTARWLLGSGLEAARRAVPLDPEDPAILCDLLPETVPDRLLLVLLLAVTLAVLSLLYFLEPPPPRREQPQLRQRAYAVVCALLLGNALTGLVTALVKQAAAQPRPNAVALIRSSGGSLTHDAEATAANALQSFPSGHASSAFSCCVFLTLLLLDAATRNRRLRALPLWPLLSLLPCGLALWIAVTRVADCWHRPVDIVAGALLGGGLASFHFHHIYLKSAAAAAGLLKARSRPPQSFPPVAGRDV